MWVKKFLLLSAPPIPDLLSPCTHGYFSVIVLLLRSASALAGARSPCAVGGPTRRGLARRVALPNCQRTEYRIYPLFDIRQYQLIPGEPNCRKISWKVSAGSGRGTVGLPQAACGWRSCPPRLPSPRENSPCRAKPVPIAATCAIIYYNYQYIRHVGRKEWPIAAAGAVPGRQTRMPKRQ